jgi:hypothetical protein
MKRLIQTGVFLLLLLFPLVLTLCFTFSHARARLPRIGVVSAFGNSVGGEPGEDPHLRVEPDIQQIPGMPGGSTYGKPCTGQGYTDPLNGYESGRGEKTSSGYNANLQLRVILRSLLMTFVR